MFVNCFIKKKWIAWILKWIKATVCLLSFPYIYNADKSVRHLLQIHSLYLTSNLYQLDVTHNTYLLPSSASPPLSDRGTCTKCVSDQFPLTSQSYIKMV